MPLSSNTQAILLLTAPLIAGRNEPSADLLTLGEYKRLARFLRAEQQQPADLLTPDAPRLLQECQQFIDSDRLERLLARGLLLSHAVERWQTRAIWVVSRADVNYPKRLKVHLKDDAPPVLYGCGDAAILDTGGLAVVGSRHVDDTLLEYSTDIGRLAAQAKCTLVSGAARGIDQAAMHGAQETGGKVTGVLADSLEQAALNRKHRDFLMGGQLVLVSPYDPSAGFNVGHAMQRNKLIYALADAALVVNSDYQKGGTWSGATEQLEKLQFVPVYIRSNGQTSKALDALRQKGARSWPNPDTPEALAEVFEVPVGTQEDAPQQAELLCSVRQEPMQLHDVPPRLRPSDSPFAIESIEPSSTAADELFAKVRELLGRMTIPKTDAEVAADLNVSKRQAREWLQRLVEEGSMQKHTRPVKYGPTSQLSLLDVRDVDGV